MDNNSLNLPTNQKRYAKKLENLAYKCFVNALEFNNDSAVLLMLGSFPSSSFASLHAQEELGKMFLIDDLCTDINDEKITIEKAESYLQKSIMRDHVLKQFFFGISVGKIAQFEMYVNNPRIIQQLRNDSLYTTYDSKTGTSRQPSKRVTAKRALYQIRFVNGALMELMGYAYDNQHAGEDLDDDNLNLEDNTIMNDLYMVDTACGTMHRYKVGDEIKVDRDLMRYFEFVKNEFSVQKKMQKASFKLLQAARLYQKRRKVKRFINY